MMPEGEKVIDFNGTVLSENDVKESLQKFKLIILNDDFFNQQRTDDCYLLRFLYASQFNLDKALYKMTKYYKFLNEYAQYSTQVSPKDDEHLLRMHFRIMTGVRDRSGKIIYLLKLGNMNPSKMSINDLMRVDDICVESALDDPTTQLHGACLLIDAASVSLKLIKWAVPTYIRFFVGKIEFTPLRNCEIHIVNTSTIFDTLLKIVWPFINQKIKDKIIFHGKSWDSLHKYIDPDNLPPEYNGTSKVSLDDYIDDILTRSDEIYAKTEHFNRLNVNRNRCIQ